VTCTCAKILSPNYSSVSVIVWTTNIRVDCGPSLIFIFLSLACGMLGEEVKCHKNAIRVLGHLALNTTISWTTTGIVVFTTWQTTQKYKYHHDPKNICIVFVTNLESCVCIQRLRNRFLFIGPTTTSYMWQTCKKPFPNVRRWNQITWLGCMTALKLQIFTGLLAR